MKIRWAMLSIVSIMLSLSGYSQSSIGFGNNGNDIANVNLSTGALNVAIPIYSYANNGADLSVAIGYNTSGIQVNRLASEVGLGWELYCGGKITREIRGRFEDERVEPSASEFGYWNNSSVLVKDHENDVFYLSLGGKTIKFIFANDGEYITIPKTDIGIWRQYETGGTLYNIGGVLPPGNTKEIFFKILDENGNKYFFEKSKWDDKNIITEWSLTKVETFEQQTISFHYIQGFYKEVSGGPTTYPTWQEKNHNYGASLNIVSGAPKFYKKYIHSIDYPNGVEVKFTYGNHRCDARVNEDVTNVLSSEVGALEFVKVKEADLPFTTYGAPGLVEYGYGFHYSYFVSNDGLTTSYSPSTFTSWNNAEGTATQNEALYYWPHTCASNSILRYRLKLDGIGFRGTNGSSYSLYSFDYSTVPLSLRGQGGFDKEGYNNGALPMVHYYSPGKSDCWDQALYFPLHYMNYYAGTGALQVGMDQSINADARYISACNLNKITNSTGGSIEMIYESLKNLGLDIGGLAVTVIKKNDGYNAEDDVLFQYTYEDPELAFADGMPINYTSTEDDYIQCPGGASPGTFSWLNWEVHPNVLNQGLNGPKFCFKKVTEENISNSLDLLNRKIYKFSGASSNTHGITNSLYTPPYSGWSGFGILPFSNKQYLRDWSLNLPITTEEYDNNGVLLKTTDYDYEVITEYISTSNFKNTRGIIYPKNKYGEMDELSASDEYYPFTGKTLLRKETKKVYLGGSSTLNHVVNYEYNVAHSYDLKSLNFLNSKGQKITINNYYNYDFPSGSAYPTNGGIDWLNVISPVRHVKLIYQDKWKLEGGVNKMVALKCQGLGYFNNLYLRPTASYELATSETMIMGSYLAPMGVMAAYGNVPNMQMTNAITKYDDKGFAIESSDFSGVGTLAEKTYLSNIVDNKSGNTLAEAKNSKYEEIVYCGFESDYGYSNYNRGNLGFNINSISTTHHLLGRLSSTSYIPLPIMTSMADAFKQWRKML